MDTLHEAKNGIHFLKTTHTEKHVHSFFYSIVFRGRHSWRNRNRRMWEEGSQFHFIAMRIRFVVMLPSISRMVAWWRHPGDGVLQIEVRVSLYEPLESLGRLN